MHGERVWAVLWSCSRIVTIADLDKRRAARRALAVKAPGTEPSHSTRERWVVKTLRKPAPWWQNQGHGGGPRLTRKSRPLSTWREKAFRAEQAYFVDAT